MSRFLLLSTMVTQLALSMPSAHAANSVEVCHRTGSAGYVAISVSPSAVPAHQRHGDPSTATWYPDADGDGYGSIGGAVRTCERPAGYVATATDCDDARGDVHPAAAEVCDGVDNDCDGSAEGADAVDASAWYADADGDGYGDAGSVEIACTAPTGSVADDTDCDDAVATTNPGAAETCSPADDDCDGVVNEADAIDANEWYTDGDGDGYGDAGAGVSGCEQPAGTVGDASDCDDDAPDVYPGAAEACNGADEDCDGVADDGALDQGTWSRDADGDGYGDATDTVTSCEAPAGYVTDATDCDDAAAAVSPAGEETCNTLDDDCDGATDEPDATDATTWYADPDGDGWGNPSDTATACAQPDGYVAEVCSGGSTTWYADADGDGFGDAGASVTGCTAPAGFVADAGDCDDAAASVNPDGEETCNGEDDDCDGDLDEAGATGELTWYADGDADGYGDAGTSVDACEGPEGFVADDQDCADGSASVNPGATEACNDQDDDCDAAIDEAGASGEVTWYTDADGDGYGVGGTTSCDAPASSVPDSGDCDDGAAAVSPGAVETCNAVDDDCDGTVDGLDECSVYEGRLSTDPISWFDAEADCEADGMHLVVIDDADEMAILDTLDVGPTRYWIGAARTSAETLLRQVPGYTREDWSWVTGAPFAFTAWAAGEPTEGATESCGAHEIGGEGWFDLACDDADLYAYICEDDGTAATDGDGDGYTWGQGDCDDTSSAANPGTTETCSGFDDDCDGAVDEGFEGQVAVHYYWDEDGDGYGLFDVAYHSCDGPGPYAGNVVAEVYGDCDDADDTVNPGADELCNGIDDDCDGTLDEGGTWTDADADGFGDPAAPGDCAGGPDLVDNDADCDDTDDAVNPDAVETCNAVDDDCDGTVDGLDECSVYEARGSYSAVSWFEAEADCEADGMHLVVIDNVDEMAILDVFDVGPNLYWIGAARTSTETMLGQVPGYTREDWSWVNGTAFSPTAWATGEPSEAATANCAAHEIGGDGWFGLDCDDPDLTRWICEADGLDATDADGDGYTWGQGDCDDTSPSISPAGAEACDGFDDDCDGAVDEGFEGQVAVHYYWDADHDGYGLFDVSYHSCDGPGAYAGNVVATNYGDCDDTDDTVSPGDFEVCNGVDDNCDGSTDEGSFYADADADRYGDASTPATCTGTEAASTDTTDCDDGDADVNVEAEEVCNTVDDDCDGTIDEAGGTWYVDVDGDGYGDTLDADIGCVQPAGSVADDGDCEDTDVTTYPGAPDDACGDGLDQDCDGDDACICPCYSADELETAYLEYGGDTATVMPNLPAGPLGLYSQEWLRFAATDNRTLTTQFDIVSDGSGGLEAECSITTRDTEFVYTTTTSTMTLAEAEACDDDWYAWYDAYASSP